MKWLDGQHSDNEADTWAWVFAHCANFGFFILNIDTPYWIGILSRLFHSENGKEKYFHNNK
jgi:hypothetical protein